MPRFGAGAESLFRLVFQTVGKEAAVAAPKEVAASVEQSAARVRNSNNDFGALGRMFAQAEKTADGAKKGIKDLGAETEKSAASGFKYAGTLERMAVRFIAYELVIKAAQTAIKALTDSYEAGIKAASDYETAIGTDSSGLVGALNAEKQSIIDVNTARGEYIKHDVTTKTYAEALAHENAATAIQHHGDALGNLQKWYTQTTNSATPIRPGSAGPVSDFQGGGWWSWQGFLGGMGNAGGANVGVDPRLSGATDYVEAQMRALGHSPSVFELNAIEQQARGRFNLSDNEISQISAYESYQLNSGAAATYNPVGPDLGVSRKIGGLSNAQVGIANMIIGKARSAGLSSDDTTALLIQALGESGLDPNAVNRDKHGNPAIVNGAYHEGLFQMSLAPGATKGWFGIGAGDMFNPEAQTDLMIQKMRDARSKGMTPYRKYFDWAHASPAQIALAMENSGVDPSHYGQFEGVARGLIGGFPGYMDTGKPDKAGRPKADHSLGAGLWETESGAPSFRNQQTGVSAMMKLRNEFMKPYTPITITDTAAPDIWNPAYFAYEAARLGRGIGHSAGINISSGFEAGNFGDLPLYPEGSGFNPSDARARGKARDRLYRQNAYGAAGAFASGGLGGAASFGLDLIAPGLGSIGLPLVSKLFGGIFGGHHKKDIGLTPSNPVWTRNEILEQQNRDLLNILVPLTAGGGSAARVQSLFNQASGQGGVIQRSTGPVRAR